MNGRDLLEILFHAALSIFGVSARELRFKDARKFKAARVISDAIVSTFGATIVYFVSSMSNLPPQMGYIMAGLVGWGGPHVIDKLLEKNTGIAVDPDTAEKGESDMTGGAPINGEDVGS